MENGECRMGEEAEYITQRAGQSERGKGKRVSHLHTLKMRKVNDCARKKPLELRTEHYNAANIFIRLQ